MFLLHVIWTRISETLPESGGSFGTLAMQILPDLPVSLNIWWWSFWDELFQQKPWNKKSVCASFKTLLPFKKKKNHWDGFRVWHQNCPLHLLTALGLLLDLFNHTLNFLTYFAMLFRMCRSLLQSLPVHFLCFGFIPLLFQYSSSCAISLLYFVFHYSKTPSNKPLSSSLRKYCFLLEKNEQTKKQIPLNEEDCSLRRCKSSLLSMYSIVSLQPIVQLVYLDHSSLLDNKSFTMAVLTSKHTLWHS